MKKIILFAAFVFGLSALCAQHLNFDNLQNVDSKLMSYVDFTSYTASDGTTIKIGDFVEFGMVSSSHYEFVYAMVPLTAPAKISSSYAGQKYEVVRITVNGKGQNKHVGIWTKSPIGGSKFLIDYEQALKAGEIVGNGMTSDKALAELEKEKKKFDLGIITEDEYNQKKSELVKYIK